MQLGLSEDDIKATVKIVTMYRNQWGTDRLKRSKAWMRNVLFYRGIQIIDWNEDSGSWIDSLSWYESSGSNKVKDGESTDLQRFIHPLTLLLGQTFIGNMSREVPKTVVKPEDARVLADKTTATAAQTAVGIIERRNHIRQMVRGEFEFLYLYGTYFKWTRGVLDGNDSGWDTQPVLGEMNVNLPDRMRCMGCGTETPADQLSPDEDDASSVPCPNCSKPMGQDSWQEAQQGPTRLGVVGMQKIPRAMVKQTIHSPLEIDADPEAKSLAATPTLSYEYELDIGEARMMFPDAWDKIHEGAESTTSDNSSYDRLRRNESYAMGSGYTTDVSQQKPTYGQHWVQPVAYNRTGDPEYAKRMMAAAPDGLKLTMIGGEVVGVKKAILTKEWTLGRLHENFGLYSQSIAENVTSFNERFNNAMYLYDDWMMRASCGLNLIDAAMIDADKWKGNTLAPATVVPVPTKFGTQRSLAEAFLHYDIPVNPALGMYPSMLLNFAQMLNGLPAQLMGNGTQPGVETLGGQQIQQEAGNTGIAPFWENVKDEHADAAQLAIECLQELLKCGAAQEIFEVIEDEGSQFRSNYVNLQKMQGRVKVDPDEDQDLPQSPSEIRAAYQSLMEELTKGNPAAQAIFDMPVNQEVIGQTLYGKTIVTPTSAQRAKTLQDIATLLQQTAEPVMNPDGSIGSKLPVEPSVMEQFQYAIPTIEDWYIENADQRIKNPLGYGQVEAYWEQCLEMQTQRQAKDAANKQKVTQAGAPPPDAPNPQQQAMVAELQKLASNMVDQLAKWSTIDPMLTKGTITGQVAAANDILEATLDANKLLAGAK
jgi:hypothetical protein